MLVIRSQNLTKSPSAIYAPVYCTPHFFIFGSNLHDNRERYVHAKSSDAGGEALERVERAEFYSGPRSSALPSDNLEGSIGLNNCSFSGG